MEYYDAYIPKNTQTSVVITERTFPFDDIWVFVTEVESSNKETTHEKD